jgi:hypothetical protein
MKCSLDKYQTYDLANVRQDVSAGKYVVKLNHPPVSCPDGSFSSAKMDVKVIAGLETPLMTYNTANNHIVISVPNKGFVQQINVPDHSYLEVGLTLVAMGILSFCGYKVWQNYKEKKKLETVKVQQPTYIGSRLHEQDQPARLNTNHWRANHIPQQSQVAPAPHSQPIIINNQGSHLTDTLATIAVMDMLTHPHDSQPSTVVENNYYGSSPSNYSAPEKETSYSPPSSSYESDNDSVSSDDSSFDSDSSSYDSDSSSYDSGGSDNFSSD